MKRRSIKKFITIGLCGLLAVSVVVAPRQDTSSADEISETVDYVDNMQFAIEVSDTAKITPELYLDETDAMYVYAGQVWNGVSVKYKDINDAKELIEAATGKTVDDIKADDGNEDLEYSGTIVVDGYDGVFKIAEAAGCQYLYIYGFKNTGDADQDEANKAKTKEFLGTAGIRTEGSSLYTDDTLGDTVTVLDGEFSTALTGAFTYDTDADVFRVGDEAISLVSTDTEITEDLTPEEISGQLHDIGTTLMKWTLTDKDGREWVMKKIENADGKIGIYAATSFNHRVYMFSAEPEEIKGDSDIFTKSIKTLVEHSSIAEPAADTANSNSGGESSGGGSSNAGGGSGSGSGTTATSGDNSGGGGNPTPVPGSPDPAPAEGYYTTDGYQIVDLINNNVMPGKVNSQGEQGSVYWSSAAEAIAKRRAKEISTNFSHEGSVGAENIGMGANSSCSDWFWMWYNSPGHYGTMCMTGGCAYACYCYGGTYYAVYVVGPEY